MEHSESVLRKAAIRKEEIRNEYKQSLITAKDSRSRKQLRDLFEEQMEYEFPQEREWRLDIQERQDLLDYERSIIQSGTNQPEMDLVSQIVELENLKSKNHGN